MRPHMHMQAHAHAHAHLPVCACARGRMPVVWRVRVRMHMRIYTCTPTRTHLQRDPPPRPALLPQVAAVTGRNLILIDPRRRAVARSACRATRHHRGARPPLQPGPQAPRAGHTDRSLSLAVWQTVTRARPAAVAVAPFDAPLLRHAPASAAAATREVAVAPATSPFLRQPPPLPDGHRHYCSRHSG